MTASGSGEQQTPSETVLSCPMVENVMGEIPLNAKTVGEFLTSILAQLWEQGRDFNAHRPYGLSDWQVDVYRSIGAAGLIEITFGEEGDIDYVDTAKGDELVSQAIASLGSSEK